MGEGLGLLVNENEAMERQHQETVCGFRQVPVAFGAPPEDLPPRWIPPLIVESQSRTNSCAGHSEALAFSLANFVETGEVIRFSRRFAYITAQQEGGFLGRDQGTSITSTIAAATKYGCCLEATFPFQDSYDTFIPNHATQEAAKHKHNLLSNNYDVRDWDEMIAWITDKRPVIIGTKWMSAQDGCEGVEDKRCGTSGSFRGYHARTLTSWDTHDGMIVPRCQNSHGIHWSKNGVSIILRELWDWWATDANFFALGVQDVDEVEPKRRDWSESRSGDTC